MEENGFHWPKSQFPPTRITSAFKNWFPFIAVTVSVCRKNLSSKVMVYIREKNPSPIARIKDLFKNEFPLDKKNSFPWQ